MGTLKSSNALPRVVLYVKTWGASLEVASIPFCLMPVSRAPGPLGVPPLVWHHTLAHSNQGPLTALPSHFQLSSERGTDIVAAQRGNSSFFPGRRLLSFHSSRWLMNIFPAADLLWCGVSGQLVCACASRPSLGACMASCLQFPCSALAFCARARPAVLAGVMVGQEGFMLAHRGEWPHLVWYSQA